MCCKIIEKYPKYSVSICGEIINNKTGRILKAADNVGYLTVKLCRNGVPKRFSVHRLVLEAFCPLDLAVAKLYQAHHVDGDRYNNNLENLVWVLTSEHRNESTNRNKRLSKETVLSILDDFYTYRISKPDLCEKYNLRPLVIANIVALRIYRKYYVDKLEYYQDMRKDMLSHRMDKQEIAFVKYHFLVNGKIIYRKGISKAAIDLTCKKASDQLANDFDGNIDLMKFRGVISPSTGDENED